VGSDTIITTVTSSLISTQFINVIPATSGAEGYSFTEENGTTSWFGNTPPATAVLVTATSFITLQPVLTPSPAVSEEASAQLTTHLTLYSTETITETSTMTLTESYLMISSPAGAYTGLKSKGWNATMTTLRTVKAATTGTGSSKPSHYQPAFKAEEKAAVIGAEAAAPSPYLPALKAEKKAASFSGTAYALRTPLANSTGIIEARQAPNIVVATIDGVVVSWTNNWTGQSPSTPVAVASSIPVITIAPPLVPASFSPLETAIPVPVTSAALPVVPISGKSRDLDRRTIQNADTHEKQSQFSLLVYCHRPRTLLQPRLSHSRPIHGT